MEQPAGARQPNASQQQPFGQRYSDEFMMFIFKVEMCKRVDKHNREQCPYAHPGELARRRHPSLYQALPCPETRAKKICPRLENCNCSHSTFEFWLHPDRYKTSMCEKGSSCNRPICFFAHSEEELRPLPQGLQRTKPAIKSVADSKVAAESSRAASGRQQQADGQLKPEGVVYIVGHAAQMQVDSQAAMGQGLAVQSQQQVDYVPVVQQAPGVPYPAAIVGQQQQPVQPQSGLPSSISAYPSYTLAQSAMYSSGSHISQQTPETSTEMNAVFNQPAPLPGPQGVSQQQSLAHQTAYNFGSVNQYHQPPYMAPSPADYPSLQGPPIGQVLIGYHPVQGYGGPQGVIMVRPSAQRGSTVAVIPAGPSTWAHTALGAAAEASGDAPSLEDLCAAMSQLAVPPPGATLPDSQLQQYVTEGGQQMDPLPVMGLDRHSMHLQHHVPFYMAATPVSQQLQLAGALQPQPPTHQVLSEQPVMLVVNPDGTAGHVAPAAGGWAGMGPGH